MKKIRTAVIGLGIGEKHLGAYQSHPNCQMVAVCDFNLDKYQMARKKYPELKVTLEADELLKADDIDLVSIASYDNYHCEHILKALYSGKHVFIEKPFCIYQEEAIRIRHALQQNTQLQISSNLVLRTSPRFLRLKQLIRDGVFGDLYHVEGDYNYGRLHKLTEGWRGQIDFYSVVYGGGLHLIDLLMWLTEKDVVEVAAYGNHISTRDSCFRYNDMVVAILHFADGMTGKIAANFGAVQPHFHELSIYGTLACFKNHQQEGRLSISREKSIPPQLLKEDYPGTGQNQMIHAFVDAILYDNPPLVNQEEMFKAMAVCFAIEKSVNTSRPVAVEYI